MAGLEAGNALNASSAENTLYGYRAGKGITDGDRNNVFGLEALESAAGNDNCAFGKNALQNCVVDQNVAVGNFALKATTYNTRCVAVGYHAASSATDAGSLNPLRGDITAVGWEALKATTTAGGLTAVGSYAGHTNTTGASNTYLGYSAGRINSTSSSNTAIGYYALYSNTAASCTAVGHSSMSQSTGANNTALGASTGSIVMSGTNNTLLGYGANPSAANANNEITLGNSSIATLRCQVTSITSLSDKRDKTDINTLDLGLDFINSLKPVKFKWQTRDGKGPKGYDAGFIAQDFQQVQKDNDADYLNLVLESNPDKLEATPGKLIPILVKAIQELKQEIELLKTK